ncbi:TRASH domain-containing protein [Ferroplasma sp.]|uniref:TRASH domain-containing protein n=1 Tax=Ferroplasma sp. TaxID=2591003 RepID=UPI00307EF22C
MSVNESRVLRILMENSNMPVSEISKTLLLNRNTVAKIIGKLNENYIEKYTVRLKEQSNSLYIIVETSNIEELDMDQVIEYYKLNNGNYFVVMNKNALSDNIIYKNINIANKRVLNNSLEKIDIYCDYCNGIVVGKPHILENHGEKLYFCCDTCKDAYIENNYARK